MFRGHEPYFCPNGWRRYSIDVGKTAREFEAAYGRWPVAYHGTSGHVAMKILDMGLKASGQGCFLRNGEGAIYTSPSIEYAGHPTYVVVWKVKNKFVQMVLQLRVDPRLMYDKKPGTLRGAYPGDRLIDPNFPDNNTHEWVIKWPQGTYAGPLNGILVYGLMMRVTDVHPCNLPQNQWWAPYWHE